MSKIYYAVTAGEYSENHIVTITEDKKKAERIAAAYDGEVEEYEDSIIKPVGFWIAYYYEKSKQWHILNISENSDNAEIKIKYEYSKLYCEMVWSTSVAAENRNVAQKIAYDKYSQWKAEREELI